MHISVEEFRKRIEFSLCQQFASEEDVHAFCQKAINTDVGVACVNPVNVALTSKLLKGHEIEISANIGFPFGSHLTEVKVLETRIAVRDGATQIDMVMDIGALKSGKDDLVLADIEEVVREADGRIVKVIIEAWVLENEEKRRASRLVEKAGANMVKTSTGVLTQYLKMVNPEPCGATIADIILIREEVSEKMHVKASGGIYSLNNAIDFLRAGTDQLGVSRGAELIKEFKQRFPEGITI
jgi:deoxyribose-phosphate aldolase